MTERRANCPALIHALRGSALAIVVLGSAAHAEVADYGNIELTGLSRDVSWPLNEAGEANSLVCNVNGPDGFLSIRSGPGTEHEILIKLERLAYVTVDTGERQGNWVRVVGTARGWTPEGKRTDHEDYGVSGWAHDGYLCSYTDYADWDELYRNRPVRHEGATRMDCEWRKSADAPPYDFECEVLAQGDGGFSAFAHDDWEYALSVTTENVGTLEERYEGSSEASHGQFARRADDPDCWHGKASQTFCMREQTTENETE